MGIIIQTTSAVAFVGLLNSIPIYPRDKLLFFHGEQGLDLAERILESHLTNPCISHSFQSGNRPLPILPSHSF